jgi:amidase
VVLDPMIGCIGVAPASGQASTMHPVYRTGGNLDLRELRSGAVIWLPVEVEGAMLSIGDLHAAMGQGEPAFVAIEAAGSATVRVGLDKQRALPAPRIRVEGATVCVGLGESFPMARRSAVEQAYDVLHDELGLASHTAYAYLCAAVSLMPAGPSGSMADGVLEAVLAVVPDPR